MTEKIIGSNEAGIRFDKYLKKTLSAAPQSFIYKMLRRKNITVNGRRATGSEILSEGSKVQFFLSDETFRKFSGQKSESHFASCKLNVLYEDDDLIFINKPAGMLSQQSNRKEDSLAEYLIAYLLKTGAIKREELLSFRPSPVNRLDRNTSGIVLCGKSLSGLRFLSEMLRNRTMKKQYLVPVAGEFYETGIRKIRFIKNEKENKVYLTADQLPGSEEMVTAFEAVSHSGGYSLVRTDLLTGKTHQIRAHLAYLGYPVLGDEKYGNREINRELRERFHLRYQLLHAERIIFPDIPGRFSYLSGKCFMAAPPQEFSGIVKALGLEVPDEK